MERIICIIIMVISIIFAFYYLKQISSYYSRKNILEIKRSNENSYFYGYLLESYDGFNHFELIKYWDRNIEEAKKEIFNRKIIISICMINFLLSNYLLRIL